MSRAIRSLPRLGSTADASRVRLRVNLRLRNEVGLRSFVAAVSDPSSPRYAHYLSPAQFERRYAPTPNSASGIAAYLRRSGLHVVGTPRNLRFVEAVGTVRHVEAALHTSLVDVRVHGIKAHIPTRPPAVPAGLAPTVLSVGGLDTTAFSRPMAQPAAPPPPAFVNAHPCSDYWAQKLASGQPAAYGSSQPWTVCGYTPQQIRGAYGVTPALRAGVDGRGQKVAIVDAYDSHTIQRDVSTYSSRHGLAAVKVTRIASNVATNSPEVPGTFIDPQGWSGEETLDVEAVHSIAPRAGIVYEGADSPLNSDLQAALNDVVANDRAQIVSNSYGSTGDFDNRLDLDPILLQAAAEGIGVYFSSGDGGDETQDPNGPGDREADSPANDPYVTAVGGTSLAVGRSNNYLFEAAWGTSRTDRSGNAWSPAPPGNWIYGGGGGTSQTYPEPFWQKPAVPGRIANYWRGKPPEADAGDTSHDPTGTGLFPKTYSPGRAVPDVSMDGDPTTGFLIGQVQDFSQNPGGVQLPGDDFHYGEYRIGGTSLSCPLFAGLMALADQAAGTPHGFANPALYGTAPKGAYRDVTAPSQQVAAVRRDFNNGLDASGGTTTTLRTMNQILTLSSTPGYDDSTGLGSPKGLAFLRALAPGWRPGG